MSNRTLPLAPSTQRSESSCVACCPLCAGAAGRLFVKESIWICECRRCGHQFADFVPAENHVASVYGDQYFVGGQAGYPDYVGEAELLRAHGRYYARMIQRFTRPGEMLDVGAAAGFILQGFLDAGWAGEGLEPNERMCEFARRELGLTFHTGTLESFPRGKQYDLLCMIQVLAHFVDPRAALQAAAALVRGGGFCLVETWNRKSWTARLLRSRWHEYSPPSVLHWFSAGGLQHFMREFGLREVARGRPAKWLNGKHAKALLNYKLPGVGWGRVARAGLRMIPDRLSIPYPAEDLFWSLYQKEGLRQNLWAN